MDDDFDDELLLQDSGSSSDSGSESDDSDAEREPFDQNAPAQYLYLSSAGTSTNMALPDLVEAGTEISILVFFLPSVVVPFEVIPLNANGARIEDIQSHLKDGLVGFLSMKMTNNVDPYNVYDVGVMGNVNQVIQKANGFSLVCTARCRFKLIERIKLEHLHHSGDYNTAWATNVKVKVLSDVEPGPLLRDSSSVHAKLRKVTRSQYFEELTGWSPVAIQYADTKKFSQHLTAWLLRWFDEGKLKKELRKGLLSFSFWVATVLPTDQMTKNLFLEQESVVHRLVLEWKTTQNLNLLACKMCGHVKSGIKDLFSIMSEGMSSHFVNSHGYIHNMFTTLTLRNISFTGRPQSKDSWFPGYTWRIINCRNCGTHIGWLFQSCKKEPKSFYGMVRSSIMAAEEDGTNLST